MTKKERREDNEREGVVLLHESTRNTVYTLDNNVRECEIVTNKGHRVGIQCRRVYLGMMRGTYGLLLLSPYEEKPAGKYLAYGDTIVHLNRRLTVC